MNITISQKEALDIFRGINAYGFGDRACGCDHGDCGCDINDLTELGALVLHSYDDSEVAAYHCVDGDLLHIVGYAHGPWMVTIRVTSMDE